jgi:hypothetical protein
MKILLLLFCLIVACYSCVPSEGTCSLIGEECQINAACASNICAYGKCATHGEQSWCADDSECQGYFSPMFCVDGECKQRSIQGDLCTYTTDCLGSMSCMHGRCEGMPQNGTCTRNEECASSLYCFNGKCTTRVPKGVYCNSKGSCADATRSSRCKPGLSCGKNTKRCVRPPRNLPAAGCRSCDLDSQQCCCTYDLDPNGISSCCDLEADIVQCSGETIALALCISSKSCTTPATYRFASIGGTPRHCVRRECGTQLASLSLCQAKAIGYPQDCVDQIRQTFGLPSQNGIVLNMTDDYTVASTTGIILDDLPLNMPQPKWVWVINCIIGVAIIGGSSFFVIAYVLKQRRLRSTAYANVPDRSLHE